VAGRHRQGCLWVSTPPTTVVASVVMLGFAPPLGLI
jgi:hypothetical protein